LEGAHECGSSGWSIRNGGPRRPPHRRRTRAPVRSRRAQPRARRRNTYAPCVGVLLGLGLCWTAGARDGQRGGMPPPPSPNLSRWTLIVMRAINELFLNSYSESSCSKFIWGLNLNFRSRIRNLLHLLPSKQARSPSLGCIQLDQGLPIFLWVHLHQSISFYIHNIVHLLLHSQHCSLSPLHKLHPKATLLVYYIVCGIEATCTFC
jgi:hypothetical protein